MRVHSLIPLVLSLLLCGCASHARLAAPPGLLNDAMPPGFPPGIRLVTGDRDAFLAKSPGFLQGMQASAKDGRVDILALSGGGSGGAFGAGALVGLGHAGARPQFELVTGVSAGALIAPFAFLGPDWDAALEQAFTGEAGLRLLRSPRRSAVARLFFPKGVGGDSGLATLVDGYVTDDFVAAVAREGATGRRLVVATTDLDKQETILWDMTAIAAQGGEDARDLFRHVLVASASVPGIFPPVLIAVEQGGKRYEELHVDGSVTTSIFATPLIAQILPEAEFPLGGAHLYMLINGQLAAAPETTTISSFSLIARSFSAQMTYKTRQSLVLALEYAQRHGLAFQVTEIPADYPLESFVDFRAAPMRALFDYGKRCAEAGRLWLSPSESVRRNLADARTGAPHVECPVASGRETPSR